jgi:hypothetical protein
MEILYKLNDWFLKWQLYMPCPRLFKCATNSSHIFNTAALFCFDQFQTIYKAYKGRIAVSRIVIIAGVGRR